MTNKELNSIDDRASQVKSLRDIAIESIRDSIVSGSFKSGYHLKERELSERMGISTTPIKEALRVLSYEGLVETYPRKGTYVSGVVDSSIGEIQQLRANIVGFTARLASLKITDDEIEEMGKRIQLMEKLKEEQNIEQLQIENSKFHSMIIKVANNPISEKMIHNVSVFDHSFRKRALKYKEEIEKGFIEHKSIFEAIKERNPDVAEERMKAHINRTTQNVLKLEKQ